MAFPTVPVWVLFVSWVSLVFCLWWFQPAEFSRADCQLSVCTYRFSSKHNVLYFPGGHWANSVCDMPQTSSRGMCIPLHEIYNFPVPLFVYGALRSVPSREVIFETDFKRHIFIPSFVYSCVYHKYFITSVKRKKYSVYDFIFQLYPRIWISLQPLGFNIGCLKR